MGKAYCTYWSHKPAELDRFERETILSAGLRYPESCATKYPRTPVLIVEFEKMGITETFTSVTEAEIDGLVSTVGAYGYTPTGRRWKGEMSLVVVDVTNY